MTSNVKFGLLSGAVSLAAALSAAPAFAQSTYTRDEYYGHMWGSGYGILGAGMMIVFWGAIIFLVVVAVRWLSDGNSSKSSKSSALDILKERLARGEIDPEEYEARRKALDS